MSHISHPTVSPPLPSVARSKSPAPQAKGGKPSVSAPIKLRVGQFNLLNFQEAHVPFYNEVYSEETVNKKVLWTADQLRRMNAPLVGFQEVFSCKPLKEALELSGVYPPEDSELVCFGAGAGAPVVALVSRYPVISKTSIADFPPESKLQMEDGSIIPISKFSRPILKVVVRLPTGHDVTVFVTHLKSKRPIVEREKRFDSRAKAVGHAVSLVTRAAEAAALRCLLVEELDLDHPCLVMGDLNDTIHSVTSEIITSSPPWKRMERTAKEHLWGQLLYSTNEVQVRASDRDVTYTHIHNGRYDVLDHILCSNHFVRGNPNHIGFVQNLQLFNDHLVDETLTDEARDVTQSDHGQVVAVFKVYHKGQEDSSRELL